MRIFITKRNRLLSLCVLAGVALCGVAYIGHPGLCSVKNQVTDQPLKESVSIVSNGNNVENNVNDKQTIEKLYHTMYQYMLTKDIDKLSAMLADDFVLLQCCL